MTGLHPITTLRRAIDWSRHAFVVWRERRAAARLARASQQELLEMDRARLLKEQRRIEKQLRKQGVAVPPPDLDDDEDAAEPSPAAFAPGHRARRGRVRRPACAHDHG